MGSSHDDPRTCLRDIKADVPRYEELQDEAVAAIPFPPGSVLELGIGTGETTRRLLATHPDAGVTGLDASPEMAFRARELGKRDLFRRVREESRSLVVGDVVLAGPQLTSLEPGVDLPAGANEQAEWCGGEIVWRADDLAVIRAVYD